MEEEKKVKDNENLDPEDFEETETDKQGNTDNTEQQGEGNSESSETEKSAEDLEKEKRAKYAEERRRKEQAEKERREREAHEEQIRKEAALQAELGLLKENPYTGKPIKDEKDLEIYKIQKSLEEQGKDPVNDLAEELANRERKAAEEADRIKKERADLQKRQRNEVADLRKKYPDLNTKDLADDPLFNEIVEEKTDDNGVCRWTITEIYEEKLRREAVSKQSSQQQEEDKQIDEHGKKVTKQVSSNPNGAVSSDKKPENMTREEFEEYWKKKYGR